MVQALIFDFDGLILDTETPTYQAWVDIYRGYGGTLPLDKWTQGIGTDGTFKPFEYLEQVLGRVLDPDLVRRQRRARVDELMAEEKLLPGVWDYVTEARARGLRTAIASSSGRD